MTKLIQIKKQFKHLNDVELIVYENGEFDLFHNDREIPKECFEVNSNNMGFSREIEYDYMGMKGRFFYSMV